MRSLRLWRRRLRRLGVVMKRRRVEMPEHLRERALRFAAAWVEAARDVAEQNTEAWLAWQAAGGRLPVEVE